MPVPIVSDLRATNAIFLERSERHWERPHYKKGVPVTTLFAADRQALRALPPQAFAPYRYTQVHTDQQGHFCLEGQHWYSSAPECAQQTLIVRIGAHSVEPLAADGRLLTRHDRVYGPHRSDSTDYRTTVYRVSQRPGAWRNSPLRSGLPDAVRVALDAAVRTDLQAALTGLAQSTEKWGYDHAVRALQAAVAVGRIQTADIVAMARRMALSPADLTSSAPVDLRPFDALLDGRVAE